MKLSINPGSLLVDIVAAAVKKIRNRPKAVARRAAKAARKATRDGPADEIDEPFFNQEDASMNDKVIVTLPDGSKVERIEPIVPLRTSTKSLVGGTFLAQVYVQLVGLIPHEGVVAALTTPEMTALVAVGLAALVARYTRSPVQPGAI